MTAWRPQRYQQIGKSKGVDPDVLKHAIETGEQTIAVDPALPPVLTLRHLAYLADVDYGCLRAVVSRDLKDPYKIFRIRKLPHSGEDRGFRIICIPNPALMRVQRWIARCILSRGAPHAASFAYAEGSSIRKAAEVHCGSRWLIKLDVRRFFESISEIAAYRVFRKLGYQPLVAFELARLCTRLGSFTPARAHRQWHATTSRYTAIPRYRHHWLGHLPQGAPTTP